MVEDLIDQPNKYHISTQYSDQEDQPNSLALLEIYYHDGI